MTKIDKVEPVSYSKHAVLVPMQICAAVSVIRVVQYRPFTEVHHRESYQQNESNNSHFEKCMENTSIGGCLYPFKTLIICIMKANHFSKFNPLTEIMV